MMSADDVLVIYVGGPLEGRQATCHPSKVEGLKGKTVICGGVDQKQSASYRFDDQVAECNTLYIRFVRLMPRRGSV